MDSIREMYRAVGPVDAVVCTAGEAAFAPLSDLTADDFQLSMPRRIRIIIVSPGWVAETLKAMGCDPAEGTPAAETAASSNPPEADP